MASSSRRLRKVYVNLPIHIFSLVPSYSHDVLQELMDLQKSDLKSFCRIEYDDNNLSHWFGLLLPDKEPYNKGAFKISIEFPIEYPFKPPKVIFMTKIYHPNIDEHGKVCLDIISPDHWKPATKTEQVINSLLCLIFHPETDHSLRSDIAEEYMKDRKKFLKNAEDYTKKHALKRPDC